MSESEPDENRRLSSPDAYRAVLNQTGEGLIVANSKMFTTLILVAIGVCILICLFVTVIVDFTIAAIVGLCLVIGILLPLCLPLLLGKSQILQRDGTLLKRRWLRNEEKISVGKPINISLKKYVIPEGAAYYLELMGTQGSASLCEQYGKKTALNVGWQIAIFLDLPFIDQTK